MKNILYIITPSEFLQYFTDFIIHKQSLGFTVNTYMLENIGNGTFSDIKNFLDAESKKIEDDYFVLLGGDASLVPSDIIDSEYGKRNSDSSYYCSQDGSHWRSVGRFPASDGDQISQMCSTAILYDNNPIAYKESLLMIAATKDNIEKTNKLSELLKQKISSVTTSCTNKEGLSEITDRIKADTSCFINYMGHGMSCAWNLRIYSGGKKVKLENFKSVDIPKFIFSPPHILSWACSTANIANPMCLGCCFMKKGAASFWGACAGTFGIANRSMAEHFWKIYTEDGFQCPQHLGEIYLQIYKCHNRLKGCKRYMLLGDPTLRIR